MRKQDLIRSIRQRRVDARQQTQDSWVRRSVRRGLMVVCAVLTLNVSGGCGLPHSMRRPLSQELREATVELLEHEFFGAVADDAAVVVIEPTCEERTYQAVALFTRADRTDYVADLLESGRPWASRWPHAVRDR